MEKLIQSKIKWPGESLQSAIGYSPKFVGVSLLGVYTENLSGLIFTQSCNERRRHGCQWDPGTVKAIVGPIERAAMGFPEEGVEFCITTSSHTWAPFLLLPWKPTAYFIFNLGDRNQTPVSGDVKWDSWLWSAIQSQTINIIQSTLQTAHTNAIRFKIFQGREGRWRGDKAQWAQSQGHCVL